MTSRWSDFVHIERTPNGVGRITLDRPRALNALDLGMIRSLTEALLAWRDDPAVVAVAIRGTSKDGPFGAFCAGGDIRFFHQAALAGDPRLEDFFTEEYTLNHLIFTYPKPYIAFMDGIVMGGGMGISQGGRCRVVTERTKMAMPETQIGLFPDVGGGYFLSRCPGHVGQYLGLTGVVIGADAALAWGLADVAAPAADLPRAWDALATVQADSPEAFEAAWRSWTAREGWRSTGPRTVAPLAPEVDAAFGADSVTGIVQALEAAGTDAAAQALATLRLRSPLMLHVVLEQLRRARGLALAEDLRLERDLVRHCFHPRHLGRSPAEGEAVEGIRALAVDKDRRPHWNPSRIEDVTAAMVAPFFDSPWPAHAHPLRHLP
ncbi:MAG: enoyl-CoA hydratase/isomerase family protein [Tepidimonas sp.]|uniref:enoyl-CoA hydratase/isomerase family protein n=1 Tax=Tepidimonas sp. TaxID=2002775 RepID=UPI00259F5A03|nr:enoyl-CoA hydratase/isomerase family protein [Tepidimonas sp.]MDM7455726.1 enoyl-CoA hydratase/isomerase family protein [Tepidimonas sp.]